MKIYDHTSPAKPIEALSLQPKEGHMDVSEVVDAHLEYLDDASGYLDLLEVQADSGEISEYDRLQGYALTIADMLLTFPDSKNSKNGFDTLSKSEQEYVYNTYMEELDTALTILNNGIKRIANRKDSK